MSYEFYKIAHLIGLIMLFSSLGAMLYHSSLGGKKSDTYRKSLAMIHGIGLLFLFVAGFGMLAKLQMHWPWPGWVLIKILIWVAMGGSIAIIYRKPKFSIYLMWILIILGALAAYLAILKPE